MPTEEALELNVFDTDVGEEELRKIVEGLEVKATGWSEGASVYDIGEGVYRVVDYRRPVPYRSCRVRVNQNQILAGRLAEEVGRALEGRRISYRAGKVSIPQDDATFPNLKPINPSKFRESYKVDF
jgi:hypothetical protein